MFYGNWDLDRPGWGLRRKRPDPSEEQTFIDRILDTAHAVVHGVQLGCVVVVLIAAVVAAIGAIIGFVAYVQR